MDDIDGEASGALYGYSVSLSSNGSKVAIVAYHNNANSSNSGYTCIYKISGGTQLQIGNDIDGAMYGALSGSHVSLSLDGSRDAIGAPSYDGFCTNTAYFRIYE